MAEICPCCGEALNLNDAVEVTITIADLIAEAP